MFVWIFSDIVVGAPYEEGGRGAIYIYKAEAKLDHYVQRVLASSISKSLYGFGCSISLPMDIDQNETPGLCYWMRFHSWTNI